MKYLTKEWYDLCQRTYLHFGMKVNDGAAVFNEVLYLRLYKHKEKEFVKAQRKTYDYDPRSILEHYSGEFIPLDKFLNGEEITEEDKVVYHMPSKMRENIQNMIEEYDARLPFDENKCKEEFRVIQETFKLKDTEEKVPAELLQQVADMRVFCLGYCTKEILKQLRRISKENNKITEDILNDYFRAQKTENIPAYISEKYGFHDCKVIEFVVDDSAIIRFDAEGGFTEFNKITFVMPEILMQEDDIVDKIWIYDEIYRTEGGYEAHMLFSGGKTVELTIGCKDIIIEKEC